MTFILGTTLLLNFVAFFAVLKAPILSVALTITNIACFYFAIKGGDRKSSLLTFLSAFYFNYLYFCHAGLRTRDFVDTTIDALVITRVLFAALMLITSTLMINNIRITKKINHYDALLILISLFILIGGVYSPVPGYTMTSAVIFLSLTTATMVLIRYYDFYYIFRLIAFSMLSLVLSSILIIILDNNLAWIVDYANDQPINRFSGIFLHPVQLGNCVSILVLYLLYTLLSQKNRNYIIKIFSLAVIVVSMYFMYLAQSRVGIVCTIVSCAYVYMRFKPAKTIFLFSYVMASILIIMFAYGFTGVLSEFTRSGKIEEILTFTGRVEVWQYSIKIIEEAPYFGHGYGSTRSIFATAPHMFGWSAPHAHNTVLEGLIEVGMFGVFLFIGTLFLSARHAKLYSNALYGALLIQFALRSVTEVLFFFYVPGIMTALYILLILAPNSNHELGARPVK